MDIINNTTHELGDDLKTSLKRGDRLKVAASCFSILRRWTANECQVSEVVVLAHDNKITVPRVRPDGVVAGGER